MAVEIVDVERLIVFVVSPLLLILSCDFNICFAPSCWSMESAWRVIGDVIEMFELDDDILQIFAVEFLFDVEAPLEPVNEMFIANLSAG